jgi:dedicator of cytokinesis protein 1
MDSCTEVLSEILKRLFDYEKSVTDSSKHDIQEIVFSCLKTIMDGVIHYFATPSIPVTTLNSINGSVGEHGTRSNDAQLLRSLVCLLTSLFRQMTPFHFKSYFGHFKSDDDLMDFLIQVLMVFQNLISHPVFPTDCTDMILHESQVILNSLKHISRCIREFTKKRFEFQLWNNYFHCGISFLTQPLLQLESFSENKRNAILYKFGDMRKDAAVEVRSMSSCLIV